MWNVKVRIYLSRITAPFIRVMAHARLSLMNKDEITIVLTPGKVGSSSLYANLKRNNVKNVFHQHFLNEENLVSVCEYELESDRKSLPLHLIISNVLVNYVSEFKKVNVISLSRDSIERATSSYFQNVFRDNYNFKENKSLDLEYILEKIPEVIDDDQGFLERWFDSEIKYLTGIDIFEKELNLNGLNVFKNEKYTLYFCRLEVLTDNLQESIINFVNPEFNGEVKIGKFNQSKSKFYSKEYSYIRSELKKKPVRINKGRYESVLYSND